MEHALRAEGRPVLDFWDAVLPLCAPCPGDFKDTNKKEKDRHSAKDQHSTKTRAGGDSGRSA